MWVFIILFDYKIVIFLENRVFLKFVESVKIICENLYFKWFFYIVDNINIVVRENVINMIIIYRYYFVYRLFWL